MIYETWNEKLKCNGYFAIEPIWEHLHIGPVLLCTVTTLPKFNTNKYIYFRDISKQIFHKLLLAQICSFPVSNINPRHAVTKVAGLYTQFTDDVWGWVRGQSGSQLLVFHMAINHLSQQYFTGSLRLYSFLAKVVIKRWSLWVLIQKKSAWKFITKALSSSPQWLTKYNFGRKQNYSLYNIFSAVSIISLQITIHFYDGALADSKHTIFTHKPTDMPARNTCDMQHWFCMDKTRDK